MAKLAAFGSTLLLAAIAPASAAAQVACDASCTAIIDVSESGAVAGDMVEPGATVCLRTNGAAVPGLVLDGFQGSEANPITVRPCGSALTVGTPSSGSLGVQIADSRHLRLTGDGGSAERAIHIVGGAEGGPAIVMGIAFSGCSSDVELDHIEVNGTSYTALRNHVEDPSCPVRSGFSVHDNHFHDLGGEGMFQAINDAASPYHVADVSVRHNLIERAGYQGIKIGVTVDGCLVEGNVVIDSGYSETPGEDTGLALGASCTVRGNVVLRSSASLVFARGSGSSYVFENNVFSGDTPSMMFQGGAGDLVIAHNTMIGSSDRAIVLYGDAPASTRVVNNLIVAASMPLGLEAGPALELAGNLELGSVAEAQFQTDASAVIPYELAETSPAVDMGVKLDGVTELDFAGRLRDASPDAGAEEFGAELPDPGAGGGGEGGAPPSDSSVTGAGGFDARAGGAAGESPSDDAGCAATPGRARRAGPAFAWLTMLVMALRARLETRRG